MRIVDTQPDTQLAEQFLVLSSFGLPTYWKDYEGLVGIVAISIGLLDSPAPVGQLGLEGQDGDGGIRISGERSVIVDSAEHQVCDSASWNSEVAAIYAGRWVLSHNGAHKSSKKIRLTPLPCQIAGQVATCIEVAKIKLARQSHPLPRLLTVALDVTYILYPHQGLRFIANLLIIGLPQMNHEYLDFNGDN